MIQKVGNDSLSGSKIWIFLYIKTNWAFAFRMKVPLEKVSIFSHNPDLEADWYWLARHLDDLLCFTRELDHGFINCDS